MSRIKVGFILMAAFGTAALGSVSAVALAHETTQAHWFEHQRALTDGLDGLIDHTDQPATNGGGARSAALARAGARGAKAPNGEQKPDSNEESARWRGYTSERWIVDEDKQMGRHWRWRQ